MDDKDNDEDFEPSELTEEDFEPSKLKNEANYHAKEANLENIKILTVEEMNTKRHYCPFCGVSSTKLPRHLREYCNEAQKNEDVKKLLSETVTKETKTKILNKLRSDGDYKHNIRGK